MRKLVFQYWSETAGEGENNGAADLEICNQIRWVYCPYVLSKSRFDHCLLVSLRIYVLSDAGRKCDRLNRSPMPNRYTNACRSQTVSSALGSTAGKEMADQRSNSKVVVCAYLIEKHFSCVDAKRNDGSSQYPAYDDNAKNDAASVISKLIR